MSVKYPDVALVIQGPLSGWTTENFTPHIPYYKTLFGEIILSTYTEQLTDEMLRFCDDNNIKVVHQTQDVGKFKFKYNLGYQTLSTLLGLKAVTKKYTIKHRTDERYSNLHKLVELFLQDDNKWVSGTTVFRPKSSALPGLGNPVYHAADHLFIAKTEKLLKTFQLTKDNIDQGIMVVDSNNEPCAEVTLCTNFVKISGDDPTVENYDTLMPKYFNVLNDANFYPFVIKFNHDNGVGSTYTEPHHGFYVSKHINSMFDVLNT